MRPQKRHKNAIMMLQNCRTQRGDQLDGSSSSFCRKKLLRNVLDSGNVMDPQIPDILHERAVVAFHERLQSLDPGAKQLVFIL